jgi:hypothetical protein
MTVWDNREKIERLKCALYPKIFEKKLSAPTRKATRRLER